MNQNSKKQTDGRTAVQPEPSNTTNETQDRMLTAPDPR